MDKSSGILKTLVSAVLFVAALLMFVPAAGFAQTPPAPETQQQSITVRLEQVSPLKIDQPPKSLLRDIFTGPMMSGIASAVASAIVALVGVKMALRNTEATLYQKSNEAQVKELQTRLNEFYGPFNQISKENELLSQEFRERHKKQKQDFRTLVALLDPNWRGSLDASDKALVEKMIQNGNDLRKLIRDKSGLVDPQIVPILAKAASHFAILEMAAKGQLENKPERFAPYVYPRELDDAITKEMARLNNRIGELLNKPGLKHKPIQPLQL